MQKLVIVRNAGKVMPRAFLDHVCPKFQGYSGMAFMEKGKFVSRHYDPASAEDIEGFLSAMPDTNALIVLGSDKPHADDKQPFILFEKDGQPRLVCSLEGSFNNFAKPESAHDPEFFVARTHLIPMMGPSYTANNGDTTLLLNELQSNGMVNASLKELPTGEGSLIFMDHTGRIVLFTKKAQNVMEFGWVSDKMGFGESQVHTIPEGASRKFGSTAVEPAPAPAAPAAPTVSPAPAAPAAPADPFDLTAPGTAPAPSTAINNPMVTISLGPDYNNQQRKDLYRSYYGRDADLPGGQMWKKEKSEVFNFQVKRSELKDRHLKLVKDVAPDSVLIPAATAKPDAPKDMRAAGAAPPAAPVSRSPIPDSREQNNALALIGGTMFQKFIVAHGELIKEPSKWVAEEMKKPAFTEHLALTLDEIENWPDECWDTLNKAFPIYGRMALTEFRNQWWMARAKIEKLEKSGNAPATTKPEPEVVVKNDNTPAPQPQSAAAAGGGFVLA